MTLDEIYALCKGVNDRLIDVFNESGGKEDTWQRQVYNVAEETGEFVGAYRRYIGMARRPGAWSEVESELADVVISSMVTAHAMGIDLPRAVRDKFIHNERRGYREAEDTTANSGEANAAERTAAVLSWPPETGPDPRARSPWL
jgi:NTP pyrophosphatase (non-canonical NTP hydrolase)